MKGAPTEPPKVPPKEEAPKKKKARCFTEGRQAQASKGRAGEAYEEEGLDEWACRCRRRGVQRRQKGGGPGDEAESPPTGSHDGLSR